MKTLKTLLTLLLPLVCAAAYGGGTLDDMRQKADALHAEGKNDSAVVVAEKALAEAIAGGDTAAIVGLNSSLGVYLRTMGKLDEALKRYGEAMKLCTTEAYKRRAGEDARQEAAVLYLNLATLHIDMQHKEQAAYYARLCADWTARCGPRVVPTVNSSRRLWRKTGWCFSCAATTRKPPGSCPGLTAMPWP